MGAQMQEPARTIVVAIDLSQAAGAVIEAAAWIAGASGARLWLIHVAEPDPAFVGWQAGPDSVREHVSERFHAEHQLLQSHADALRRRGQDATALLVQGDPAERIVAEGEKLGADIIVLGSRGHGPTYEFLVGSVAHDVLRHAPCPVLLVPVTANL
ncbi:MAG: universal stress protein [Defluviicoccus sp.]